jgi:hypothetical protein
MRDTLAHGACARLKTRLGEGAGDLDLDSLVSAVAGRSRAGSEDAGPAHAAAAAVPPSAATPSRAGSGDAGSDAAAVEFPPLAWGFDAEGAVVDAALVKRTSKAARAASEGIVSALLAVVVAGGGGGGGGGACVTRGWCLAG